MNFDVPTSEQTLFSSVCSLFQINFLTINIAISFFTAALFPGLPLLPSV